MLEQLRQMSMLLANVRNYAIQIEHENEELRKRYTALQKEYDECKRNLEKATQEVSTNES